MWYKNISQTSNTLKHTGVLLLLLLSCVVLTAAPVYALTNAQQKVFRYGVYAYDSEINTACAAASVGSGSTGNVSTTDSQAAIAKIVIGIAKTDNLGRAGALIGLMVGLTESKLTIYANSNVPLSLTNPAKQAVGSDHDSLGVFQQRISMNWSTISSSPNDKAAVYQLMDPAYNAEAFFGSPSGSNAPSALSKGLQNVSGWQSLDPWVAAQKVQGSGTPDGSNYKVTMPTAQALLNKYWDAATAVPLPVPFTGGSTSPTGAAPISNSTCTASTTCTSTGTGVTTLSPVRQNAICFAQKEYEQWKSGALTPGDSFHKYSQGRDENWCADFVSWVYNQAQYPIDANAKDGNVPAVVSIQAAGAKNDRFHYNSAAGYTPRPGDIAIHGTSHTNLVTAVSGSAITLIGGNQVTSDFKTSSVSQYNITSSTDDGITGYVSPD